MYFFTYTLVINPPPPQYFQVYSYLYNPMIEKYPLSINVGI